MRCRECNEVIGSRKHDKKKPLKRMPRHHCIQCWQALKTRKPKNRRSWITNQFFWLETLESEDRRALDELPDIGEEGGPISEPEGFVRAPKKLRKPVTSPAHMGPTMSPDVYASVIAQAQASLCRRIQASIQKQYLDSLAPDARVTAFREWNEARIKELERINKELIAFRRRQRERAAKRLAEQEAERLKKEKKAAKLRIKTQAKRAKRLARLARRKEVRRQLKRQRQGRSDFVQPTM